MTYIKTLQHLQFMQTAYIQANIMPIRSAISTCSHVYDELKTYLRINLMTMSVNLAPYFKIWGLPLEINC